MLDDKALSALGPRQPTHCLSGVHGMSSDHPKAIVAAVLNRMFDEPFADVRRFCEIEPNQAIRILCAAMTKPLGTILDNRPVDHILADAVPLIDTEAAFKQVSCLRQFHRYVTNLNLDGSWEQVSPNGGDLAEVLLVALDPHEYVAIYWSEPID